MTRSSSSGDVTGAFFRVNGRVQGVGFRWWTQSQAQELGLTGTVRNAPDGSVEIHAWGTSAALEIFSRRLHVGPATAQVDQVAVSVSSGPQPSDFRAIG